MITITVNSVGASRREKLGGKEYIVVPMTMIVPGVLNGSKGPIFYSADENRKSAPLWNGMPIVLSHPYNASGEAISARRADVLNSSGLGMVLESKTDDNGKLQSEGWFEVEATKTISPSVYNKLLRGEQFELSTGLLKAEVVQAPDGAVYNGVQYNGIAMNYQPDHLAVLPDGGGACSLLDGCGVLVNEGEDQVEKYKSVWNHLTDMLFGNKTKEKESDSTQQTEVTNAMSQDQIRALLSEQLRGRFDQNSDPAYILSVFEDEGFIVFEQGYEAYRLDFTRDGDTVTLSSDAPVKGQLTSQFIVTNEDGTELENSPDSEDDMKLTNEQKKAKVDALITNCKCGEGKAAFEEKDRDYLMKLDDRVLNSMGSEDPQPEPEPEPVPPKDDKAAVHNQAKPLTEEDLPESMRSKLAWADREMENKKKQIITKMIANARDEDTARKLSETYSKLTLNELESRYSEFQALMPQAFNRPEQPQDSLDYSGASSAISNASDKPKPIGLPNWDGQFAASKN